MSKPDFGGRISCVAKTTSFHQQLIEKLRKLLRGRQFDPGEKFLTEREIAERFKTSRPTANKALSSLVSAGLLEIRQGAGTFVRESVLDYDLQRLVSFTDKARAAGRKPGTRVITLRKVTEPEIAATLHLEADEPLWLLERVRLADNQPLIFERRHVVAAFCPRITKTEAAGSLYAFWTKKCGLSIAGATETIRAVNTNKVQAAHLCVCEGAACLQVVATGHLADGKALWHEETLYRSDVYEFRNQLGGLTSPKPAVGAMR